MNAPGAYDHIDMHGLPDALWREIPVEAQERMISAFPDMRILWNPRARFQPGDPPGVYQCVMREPGVQSMHGLDGPCVMQGWQIIPGNYTRPLEIDRIVNMCRKRQELSNEAYAKHGGVAAYAEELAQKEIDRLSREETDTYATILGLNLETGYASPFRPSTTKVGYGTKYAGMTMADLPIAPDALNRMAFGFPEAKGPGRKELARRERRLHRQLREGTPQ